ncbi:MAG: OmpA family protein [Vicingaceae bacterium]
MRSRWVSALLTMAWLMLLCLGNPLSAQNECEKASKQAKKYFEQAEKLNFKGDQSYFLLKKAIAEDPEFAEAYLRLGEMNQQKLLNANQLRGRNSKSSVNFEKRMVDYYNLAMEYCPQIEDYRLNFLLGEFFFIKREFSTARAYLSAYRDYNSHKKKNSTLMLVDDYLEQIDEYFAILNNPVPFKPVKVRGASTPSDEYLPSLSPDNKYLFFTRKKMVNRMSSLGSVERELFIRSENNYNGSFEEGIPMPDPFNRNIYQGGSSISVDNKMIFVTVIEQVNVNGYGFSNGDIYFSEFKDGIWTELKSIGNNINGRTIWEGQPSISADNKTLYFSRAINKEIPGEHFGLMDIYKTERNPDGTWKDAINLGPEINTSGNEKSPFMHSDSYTLYFSSDNRIGMGGFDIFYSKMDENRGFTKAVNLGHPINTENDEHGFIVSTDGRYGYFASSLDEDNLDIYSFELYQEARPEQVVFVKGKVISDLDAAIGLEIKLKNVETKKEIEAVIDEETGEYVGVIAVKENEDVLMTAKKDGYAFTSQYISSNENVVGNPIATEMDVKAIKKGESYRINDITFATNQFDLNNKVRSILIEFAGYLESNSKIAVELRGHTDNVGRDEENQLLSENRARAVYDFLISQGIDSKRLSYKGFGPFKPVADNSSLEGRRLNRRTEFLVISD